MGNLKDIYISIVSMGPAIQILRYIDMNRAGLADGQSVVCDCGVGDGRPVRDYGIGETRGSSPVSDDQAA